LELQLNIGNFSDVGKARKINEDNFGSISGTFGILLIICDGMGGYKGGEIASQTAVKSIENHFEKLNGNYDPSQEIYNAFNSANNSIIQTAHNDSTLSDMGSTVVLVLLKNGLVHYANLGDSRIYRIRQGKILQLTKDNSLVQQMIDSNIITENEAKTHPKKHVITKALGIDADLKPEMYQPFKLQENDIIILCSDGLTEHVEEEEILKLAGNNSVSDAAIKLVDLANERGGSDNITIQVAKAGVPSAVNR
jgi:PPM family protein phosphatase